MEYDRTPLPEVYREARALPVDARDVWARAIRDLCPPGTAVTRVVDLGCGTARFTGMLAEVFDAVVVGVDPSLRMLAQREVGDVPSARFIAGWAEALPLAAGAFDLVFASMVYHHFHSQATALAEMRRVLRPGGRVMIRNPTRDSVDGFMYLHFFPEALAIDRARMPGRQALVDAFAAAGFAPCGHEIVRQRFAADHADYYRKISLRGLSSLQLISDEAFERGRRDFEIYCRAAERGQPIEEPVEVFLFATTRR